MGGECVNVACEGVDDELQLIGGDGLDNFLDDMIGVCIAANMSLVCLA